MKHRYSQSAFTLAELLIALAILGVIATFTIPKILENQNNTKRNAILKETLSTLSAVTYEGYLQGQVLETVPYTQVINYYMGKLNAVKVCPNDMTAEGCWPAATDFGGVTYTEEDEPGLLLHNGAVINFWPGYTNSGFGIVLPVNVDWNGSDGSNTYQEDTMHYYIGLDDDPSMGYKPGTVKACCDPNSPPAGYADFWFSDAP